MNNLTELLEKSTQAVKATDEVTKALRTWYEQKKLHIAIHGEPTIGTPVTPAWFQTSSDLFNAYKRFDETFKDLTGVSADKADHDVSPSSASSEPSEGGEASGEESGAGAAAESNSASPQSRFEVGDRVIATHETKGDVHTGLIVSIDFERYGNTYPHEVMFDEPDYSYSNPRYGYFQESELQYESVEPEPAKHERFSVGDRVRDDDGDEGVVETIRDGVVTIHYDDHSVVFSEARGRGTWSEDDLNDLEIIESKLDRTSKRYVLIDGFRIVDSFDGTTLATGHGGKDRLAPLVDALNDADGKF